MEIIDKQPIKRERKERTFYDFANLLQGKAYKLPYKDNHKTIRASVSKWNTNGIKKVVCFKQGDFIIYQLA